MVKLLIKKGDESQFLCEALAQNAIDDILPEILAIYNGRLKIHRICSEMEQLANHGTALPVNMQGLTDEQIVELKLIDDWGEKCAPNDFIFTEDKCGRRNGKAPNKDMQDLLKKTITEAKELISKKLVEQNSLLPLSKIDEAMRILRGAIMISYPKCDGPTTLGLPPHDPIRMEFENKEDLTGTQDSKDVIPLEMATLWWAGKELVRGKKLSDFVGKNDKTKIVAKLSKKGAGAPGREPIVSEQEQKEMMLFYHRKQEEWKKMQEEESSDTGHLNADWADGQKLKRQFQGVSNISWKPR